jgi:hypothetical protein
LYQQSFNSLRNEQRGKVSIDKHKDHLAASVIKESSDYILNTSSSQLTSIKNNLLSHQHCPNQKLGQKDSFNSSLVQGLIYSDCTIISTSNLIADKFLENTLSIKDLTHIAEIQENHL